MRKSFFATGIGIFILGFYFCLFQEINLDDETWFLQVVHRIVSKEVLYRDVFFGATPLSVYIPAFFCHFLGSELLVLRGVLALYFTGSVLFCCGIKKELHLSNPFGLFFILAFFIFSHPQSTWGFSGYNPLAKMLFLGCLYFALRWVNKASPFHVLMAAAFAGLCFCAKQNVGVLAFFCLVCTIFRKWKWTAVLETFLISTFTFFSIIGLCFLLIFLQGGWDSFVDYALLNKKHYLQVKHCSYFLTPSSWKNDALFIFAAPLILFLSFLKKEKNLVSFTLWIFLLGSILTLYPRPDNVQKALFVSMTILVIVYTYPQIKKAFHPKLQKALQLTVFGWFSVSMIFSILSPSLGLFRGKKRFSSLPHFRDIVIDKNCHFHWKQMKKQCTSFEESCFFLSTHAGFYYLLFHLKNPTPYDYPIHPALGCHGEQEIQKKIQTYQIGKICMDHSDWSNWQALEKDRRPFALETFISECMEKKESFGLKDSSPIFQTFRMEGTQ